MKTKDAIALRCNYCQRNLPANCFRLRHRTNDRGYEYTYREQPCKECRPRARTENEKKRRRERRKERYWEKKSAEQAKLNGKRPPPKRSELPRQRKIDALLIECNVCHELLPRSAYYDYNLKRLVYQCAECVKVYERARKARRRAEDPEWYASELAKLKAWRKANPERNRLSKRLYDKRRTAAMVANGQCTFTDKEWKQLLKIYNYRCFYCGQRGGDKTRDHIVPLAKGGEHTMENIVPCCPSCNSHKRQLALKEFVLLRMTHSFT